MERLKVYFEDANTGEWYGEYYTNYQFREGQNINGVVPDKKVTVKEVTLKLSKSEAETNLLFDVLDVEQCVKVVVVL